MFHSGLWLMVVGADAHGQLTLPPSRNGGTLQIGSHKTGKNGESWHWYSDDVLIPGDSTLPDDLFTTLVPDPMSKHPWLAPGTAPTLSPCGIGCVVNGDPFDHVGSPQCADPDTHVDGRSLPKTDRTVWQQGGTAEVAWTPDINHGGGYAYRLCPSQHVTDEACFQRPEHHLEFSDDTHTIYWTDDGTEETIPAKRTKIGTFPAGSHWTMNPIPTDEGPAPWPSPCSLHSCAGSPGIFPQYYMSLSIKDQIKVPTHLAPGDYTLSWRWDTEMTPQIWTNCADIRIVASMNSNNATVVV